tara:strand:- start:4306 stop:6156 length:1851 start_codon:yes stop_codon:yes gene_type:complete
MGVITNMRSQMQVVMWTILVLFVTSMVIGGLVGGASISDIFGQRQGNEVGSLNGKPILYEDFNQMVSNEINRLDALSGKEISDEEREYVRAVVWERLLADLIVQEQIENNNIKVGDSEVLFQLQNNPPPFLQNSEAFQTDGRFDFEKYLDAVLNPSSIDWRPVEQFMQEIYLPSYKLQQYITNSISISPEDIRKNYEQRFVDYEIEVLHITKKSLEKNLIENMLAERPTNDELTKMYQKNIDNYEMPEMRVMKYVKWPILSDANDTLRVKLEADDLMFRINNGEDFAQLANTYTEDPSNSINPYSLKGGNLGWFDKGQMVPEFDLASFDANKGDIVGPVLTDFGYHIIKIEDKRTTEDGNDQVNASHILLTIKPGRGTENNLKDTASIFALEAEEYGFFNHADSLGMEVFESNDVEKESIFINDIGVARNAVNFAFRSDVGSISEPVKNDNFFLVFYLDKIKDKTVKSLDDVREELTLKFENELTKEQIKSLAESLGINSNTDLSNVAELNENFEYVNSVTSKLNGSFQSIGKSNYVVGALKNAKIGDLLGPLPTIRGEAFVKVLNIGLVNEADFDEKKQAIKESLIISRQNSMWSNWLQALKEESDIEDYRYDFY